MRKTSSGKHMSQRALLRAKVGEISEKFGKSFLSLLLAISLVPTTGVAYALGEDEGAEASIEQSAESELSAESVVPEEEEAPSEPVVLEEAPAPQEVTDDMATQEVPDEAVTSGDEGSGAVEELVGAVEETNTKKLAAPNLKLKAANEDSVKVTISFPEGTTIAKGKAYFKGSEASATLTISGDGLEAEDVVKIVIPEEMGVTAAETSNTLSTELTISESTDFSGITVEYNVETQDPENPEQSITTKKTARVTDAPWVVFDNESPTIEATLVNGTGDDAKPVELYSGTNDNYILESDESRLYIKVTATENEAIDTSLKSTVTWNWDNGGGAARPSEDIQLDENGVGYSRAYSKDDFVSDEKLIVGTVTLNAKDLAGNSAESKSISFTSESKLLLKATDSVSDDLITVAPATDVNTAQRDGKEVYNGNVEVKVGDYNNNLALEARDGETQLDFTDGACTISAEQDKNAAHNLTFDFTAKTDRSTNGATKTVSITKEFDIDTTTPELTLTMSEPTMTVDESGTIIAIYGSNNALKLTVSAENDSTLDSNNPYTYALVDENGNKASLNIQEDGTISLDNSQMEKDFYINVVANTIFGITTEPTKTDYFVVDGLDPRIEVSFSGPSKVIGETENAIIGFLGFFNEETETINAGTLKIKVTDRYLSSVTVTGINGLNEVEPSDLISGEYEIEVPYIQTDDGIVFVGEGNEKTIGITAKDKFEQEANYTYSHSDGRTKLPEDLSPEDIKDLKGNVFTIDVTPVKLVKVDIPEPDYSYTDTNDNKTVNVYDADSVEISIYVADANFDDANSSVYVNDADQSVTWAEAGTIDDVPQYKATLNLSADGNSNYKDLRLVANDYLGNETCEVDLVDVCGHIVLDNQAPDIQLSLASPEEPSGSDENAQADFYNEAVTFNITIKDPFLNKNSIQVIKNDEDVAQSISWNDVPGGVSGTISFENESAYNTPYTLSVSAQDYTDSDDIAESTYKDVSPNGYESFYIDLSDPKVTVRIDQARVGASLDGVDYYATTSTEGKLTATITVTDLALNENESAITVSEGSTGQASEWTDNENGTWTATITFEETPADVLEGFTFTATAFSGRTADYEYGKNDLAKDINTVDATGKAVSPEKAAFVLDTIDPVVLVEFTEAPVGTSVDDNGASVADYYAAAPTAKITVTDNNFDANNSKISPVGGAITKNWEQQGGTGSNTWVAEVTFGENREGDYKDVWTSTLGFAFQDKVYTASESEIEGHNGSWDYATGERKGQKVSGASDFVVDLTQPTVSVSISEPAANNFDSKDFFGTVNGDGYLVATITVNDNNFDTASEINPTNAAKTETWTTSDARTYTAKVYYKESAGIENPSDLVLDVFDMVYTVANNKGDVEGSHRNGLDYRDANTRVQSAEGTATGFVIDLTAPIIDSVVVDQSPTSTGAGNEIGDPIQFFNVATSMTFTISDVNGLKSVSLEDPEGQYTVSSEGTHIPEGATKGTFAIALEDGATRSNDTEYERDIKLSATDMSGNTRIWTIDRTGEVTSMRSESAANRSINDAGIFPVALIKDVTAPMVTLSGVTAGIYTNQTQTATATVIEFNFNYLKSFDGARSIVRIIKQEGNAGRAQSVIEVPAAAFEGGGSNWSNTQTFSTDGHYTLEASFRDYANNQSNVATIGEFTIDKTPPVIDSIVFDNNNVRNGRYYNAGRTATITITEHNWDDSLAVITSNGVISGWSTNGDTHVATVSFLSDGDYNLSVSVTDKAGNAAEQKADDFTIDLTAPKIEFADVVEGTAYNDTIAPSIIYTDEKNFDTGGIQYTIAGSKHGTQYASQLGTSRTDSGTGATVTFSDFIREVEFDDIYTINASMTDLAGNEAENSITFSVNRFGSNFIIVNAEELEGARHNGYLSDPVEVLIEEINVSGAESQQHGVSVTHGLDTENLELQSKATPSSTGYYIESVNDSAHWAHYTYHVYKPNFDVDGNYHVVVSSNDRATNKNNSASYYNPEDHAVADAEVSFILDTTDPIIDGLNVTPSTKENASTFDVTFTVTDNIAVDTVEVTLDGQTQQVEPDLTGLCTVSVPAKSFTRRSISILATDLAGRTASAASEGFRVTTNFIENYWPGLAAAGAAGAGGGWWFLAGKRRKDEDEEEAA